MKDNITEIRRKVTCGSCNDTFTYSITEGTDDNNLPEPICGHCEEMMLQQIYEEQYMNKVYYEEEMRQQELKQYDFERGDWKY